jgi:putative membrane protein insertion efficiency factor
MKKIMFVAAILLALAVSCPCFWDSEWDNVKSKDPYSEQDLNAAMETETSCPRIAVMSFIRFYQGTLSGRTGGSCEYYPSCSRYGLFAVKKYGVIKGTLMAADRVIRCNPWTCGYEIEDEKNLFFDPPERESTFNFIFDFLNF